MKTPVLKRIKGLLSLALCGAMLMGNGMTAAAVTPDYSYSCKYYSIAGSAGQFQNIITDQNFTNLFGIGQEDGEDIIDYMMSLSNWSADVITVFEGGKSFSINIDAQDNAGAYETTNKLVFNILVNGSLVKQNSQDLNQFESGAISDTITLGESGSYYVWTYFEDAADLERYTYESSVYLNSETSSSPYTFNMNFKQVYDVWVEPQSGTMEYKDNRKTYSVKGQWASTRNQLGYYLEKRFALPGEYVKVKGGSGATYEVMKHIEVRLYNSDMTDYEVIPLSELGEKKETDLYGGECVSFVMPKGNISVNVTTDEAALQDDYFVSRYSVEAKAATCSESGNVAYLQCPVCEKYYVNEGDSWVEKEEADIVIPASSHANARKVAAKESTCTATGNIEYYECPDCGKTFKDSACKQEITKALTVTAKKEHSYVSKVIPASPAAEGSTYKECSLCKAKKDEAVIAKPVVTLKQDILTYNKKVQTAKVVVKDTDGKTIDKSSYTVTYANKKSKAIGQYKVTVNFKGNYDGLVKLTYAIGPKTISLKQGEISKTSIKLNWTENPSVKGYEIQYSTDKNFKTAVKTVAVSKATKTSVTISKLKAGKTYYFRARTYTTVNKKKVPSVWSNTLKLATKKK